MRIFAVLIITLAFISSNLTLITVYQYIQEEDLERTTQGDVTVDRPYTLDFVVIVNKSFEFVYSNSLYLSIGSWAGLIGAAIWRGKIRRAWVTNGFDYNHFVLMVKLRGSKTRSKILQELNIPKPRQLIAKELNLAWNTVDRHVEALLKQGLIEQICSVGQATYYIRSQNGNKLLNLLNNEYPNNYDSIGKKMENH